MNSSLILPFSCAFFRSRISTKNALCNVEFHAENLLRSILWKFPSIFSLFCPHYIDLFVLRFLPHQFCSFAWKHGHFSKCVWLGSDSNNLMKQIILKKWNMLLSVVNNKNVQKIHSFPRIFFIHLLSRYGCLYLNKTVYGIFNLIFFYFRSLHLLENVKLVCKIQFGVMRRVLVCIFHIIMP